MPGVWRNLRPSPPPPSLSLVRLCSVRRVHACRPRRGCLYLLLRLCSHAVRIVRPPALLGTLRESEEHAASRVSFPEDVVRVCVHCEQLMLRCSGWPRVLTPGGIARKACAAAGRRRWCSSTRCEARTRLMRQDMRELMDRATSDIAVFRARAKAIVCVLG